MFKIGVAGGVGCGVGFTTTTRGKLLLADGGVEGRRTAGRIMGSGGLTISQLVPEGLSSPCPGEGDRTGEITLFGSMSTINLPTDGLDFGRLNDRLKHELKHGEVAGAWLLDGDT